MTRTRRTRSRRSRKRRLSRAFKRLRAVALMAVVAGAVAWSLPEPDAVAASEATSNAEVLAQMVDRYAAAHHGRPCHDLASLASFMAATGMDLRVRNPYSGVIAGFDDPAIARPLFMHRGAADEAGVLFYRAHRIGPGQAAWEIRVADGRGMLTPPASSVQLAEGLR